MWNVENKEHKERGMIYSIKATFDFSGKTFFKLISLTCNKERKCLKDILVNFVNTEGKEGNKNAVSATLWRGNAISWQKCSGAEI